MSARHDEVDEQAAAFAGLADDLLSSGREGDLVDQLADPELVEVWEDPLVLGVLAEAHGRHAARGRLADVAALEAPDVSLLLPVLGCAGLSAVLTDGTLVVEGLVRGGVGRQVAVVLDDDVLLVDADSLTFQPTPGLDPSLELHRVVGSVSLSDVAPLTDASGSVVTTRVLRFVAHELVGLAEHVVTIALDHVRTRHQFGVPIGSFQTVRHRLVDAHVKTVAAKELLAAVGPDAVEDVQRLVLKASAGAAARSAIAAAQQVCGAMGFTDEFGLHPFVRRTLVLDSLLGGGESAENELGALALAGRVLPDREVALA